MLPLLKKVRALINSSSRRLSLGMDTARGEKPGVSLMVEETVECASMSGVLGRVQKREGEGDFGDFGARDEPDDWGALGLDAGAISLEDAPSRIADSFGAVALVECGYAAAPLLASVVPTVLVPFDLKRVNERRLRLFTRDEVSGDLEIGASLGIGAG
jgi:hypothetical protein